MIKPWMLIAIGVVCLAVGSFAGYILGTGAVSPLPVLPVADLHDGDAVPVMPAASLAPSPRPAATAPVRSEAAPPVQQPADTPRPAAPREANLLARAIAAEEVPDLPVRGDGVITGRVTLPDGTGLAGIEVWATPSLAPQPPVDADDTEAWLRRLIQERKRREAGRSTAFTVADGRFTLLGIAQYTYQVTLRTRGYRVEAVGGGRANFVEAGGEVEFVAHPQVEVTFEVVYSDGSVPDVANISIVRQARTGINYTTWSPGSPSHWIEPDSWEFSATAREQAFRAPPVNVELRAGEPAPPVRLVLEPRNGIRGTIAVPFGYDSAQFQLRYVPEAEESTLNDLGTFRGFGGPGTMSVRDRRFTVYDLESGNWVLAIYSRHNIELDRRRVQVGSGFAEVELRVPEPDREGYIPVRVLGPDGKPVSDVRFNIRAVRQSGSSGTTGQAVRREDGSYWLEKHNNDTAERWEITATHQSFGQLQTNYAKEDTHELVIRFEQGAVLTVDIPGAAAHPQRRFLRVALTASDDFVRMYDDFYTFPADRDQPLPERRTFPARQPGPVTLVLHFTGESGRSSAVQVLAAHPLELRPGEQSFTLHLPTLHDFTVRLPEDARAAGVTLMLHGQWISAQIGENREATFQGLPPGNYLVSASGVAGQTWVRVPTAGVFPLTWQEVNAWLVHRHRGMIGEDPGLRNGDFVLSVNGATGNNRSELNEITTRARREESVVLDVLRDGNRLRFNLSREQFTWVAASMNPAVRP
jgi:hypothetical protein